MTHWWVHSAWAAAGVGALLAPGAMFAPCLGDVPRSEPPLAVRACLADRYEVPPGAAAVVGVHGMSGAVGEPLPWPGEEESAWVFERDDHVQRNADVRAADGPGGRTVLVSPARPGGMALGLDLRPRDVEVAGGDLATFAAARISPREISPRVSARLARPVLAVRRFESTKLVLRSEAPGSARSPSPTILSKTGQQAEIRFLMDPTATPIGGDIGVRVYAMGRGWEGARVIATNLGTGASQAFSADAHGIGSFTLDAPGTWLVEFHAIVEPRGADEPLSLYSASAVFHAPAQEDAR